MARKGNTAPWAKPDTFEAFVKRTERYNAAIKAAGDTPWHKGDLEARRELWERRYKFSGTKQPQSLKQIREQR